MPGYGCVAVEALETVDRGELRLGVAGEAAEGFEEAVAGVMLGLVAGGLAHALEKVFLCIQVSWRVWFQVGGYGVCGHD